jgi:2-keto-4-pentenoate hydratase/2-oxohepta-3-ene-1,7-dioic acid hydratase in catechol pathway
MRWVRFAAGDFLGYGVLAGERVAAVRGTPFTEYERTGAQHALRDVKLHLPFEPRTFYAVGQNYSVHASQYPGLHASAPTAVPTQPAVAYRAHSGLIAHEENVLIPPTSTSLQYEGELVVVIGKGGKRISRERAFNHVLGYTIGNDVSERGWQKSDRTPWRAKNADTFSPMGPWIETEVDLERMETIVRVNGSQTTRFQTRAMLFGIDTFISTVSEYVTLQPGDMFWMGTEGSSPDLQDQDVVEVEITGIGVLRNRFVREVSG